MKHILVFVIFIMSNMAVRAQGFSVGHAQAAYIDATRANRNVTCELYYPADAAGDNVAIAAGVFPVVVIGHGFVMSASVYDIYWNALVPEGYVVAVPTTEGSLFPSHDNFGKDMAFLVSQLQLEGTNAASFLYNAIATTSAVMGHSMGGGSAFLAMQANPNITAMAAMAPAETNPSAVGAAANIQRPTLIFAGINDCVAPPADHHGLPRGPRHHRARHRVEGRLLRHEHGHQGADRARRRSRRRRARHPVRHPRLDLPPRHRRVGEAAGALAARSRRG